MEIHKLSRGRFLHTVGWGLMASILIVGIASGLGRGVLNLKGALTDKPHIAVFLLLPDEGIKTVEILKEEEDEVHIQAETDEGPKFIIMKKGEVEWFVSEVQNLKE